MYIILKKEGRASDEDEGPTNMQKQLRKKEKWQRSGKLQQVIQRSEKNL
jgi:hypothetical protein